MTAITAERELARHALRMPTQTQSYVEMMKIWRDAAKSLEQLATAALLLPTFFLRDILGVPDGAPLLPMLNGYLIAAWAFFLAAIFLSTIYQITVARLIGDAYSRTYSGRLYPHLQFWTIGASLVLGFICFGMAFVNAKPCS